MYRETSHCGDRSVLVGLHMANQLVLNVNLAVDASVRSGIDKTKLWIDDAVFSQENMKLDESDWAGIAKAFGKDGVQALMIDEAAPKISAVANELLVGFDKARCSIALETLR